MQLAPNFTVAREFLGQALTLLGRPDQAIEQLDKVLELDPSSPPVLLKLAHAKAAAGFGDEADRLYEQVFRAAPELPPAG